MLYVVHCWVVIVSLSETLCFRNSSVLKSVTSNLLTVYSFCLSDKSVLWYFLHPFINVHCEANNGYVILLLIFIYCDCKVQMVEGMSVPNITNISSPSQMNKHDLKLNHHNYKNFNNEYSKTFQELFQGSSRALPGLFQGSYRALPGLFNT